MVEKLLVQFRNALLDVSTQLESYLSDELLGSTVFQLQQLCCHLLVFAGTNSNELITSINLVLSCPTTCENRQDPCPCGILMQTTKLIR